MPAPSPDAEPHRPGAAAPAAVPPPAPTAEHMALDAALAQLDAGDFEAALAVLTPFDARATLAETRITLSRIAMTQGRFDAALAQLERAEDDHPQHPGVLRALAAMHELAR